MGGTELGLEHMLALEHGMEQVLEHTLVLEHGKEQELEHMLALEHGMELELGHRQVLEHGKELVRDRRVLEGCMEQAHDTQEDCKEPGSMEQEEQECIASWVWPPDSQPGLGSC